MSKKSGANECAIVARLAKTIEKAAKSTKFCVSDCLLVPDPGLEFEGLGAIKFPPKRTTAKELVAYCQASPFGKGTQTLVNKKVRNTYELDPTSFRFSDDWSAAITDVMRPVAEQLGLPSDELEARLYKLLMYEKGGVFLLHRDSEKHDRMVATMIVVLPNRFEGGRLIVRHGAGKEKLMFQAAAAGRMPCFAAFYGDCEHEVERVTSGVRFCLTYNLVLKSRRNSVSAVANGDAPAELLAASLRTWILKKPGKLLVFALEHHYTQRGLSLNLLKGADRPLADLVAATAAKTDCMVHLAQVSRHLLQFADDGSYGEDRYDGAPRRRALEIGETYEDDLSGTEWTDLRGKKQPWHQIAFELSAIASSTPIQDWIPTSEDYEGYAGNEGNTLDRWYHRSAIVVWHRDHHFEVIASGAADSIPLFCSMMAKLAKMPKTQMEAARGDCIRFARAIVATWPSGAFRFEPTSFARRGTRETSPLDCFPEQLLMLHDRDTIAMFLRKMSEHDQTLPLSSFVTAASREFGGVEAADRIANGKP